MKEDGMHWADWDSLQMKLIHLEAGDGFKRHGGDICPWTPNPIGSARSVSSARSLAIGDTSAPPIQIQSKS